jgi:hypothetical protein
MLRLREDDDEQEGQSLIVRSSLEMEMEQEHVGTNTSPNRPPWTRKKLYLWILGVVVVLFAFLLVATETRTTRNITPEDHMVKDPSNNNNNNNNQDSPTPPYWLQPEAATNPPYKPEWPCMTARGDPCYARPYTYQKRAREFLSSQQHQDALHDTWGSWTLEAPPTYIFNHDHDQAAYNYSYDLNYPNRDVPWDQCHSQAWQRDTVYVQQL